MPPAPSTPKPLAANEGIKAASHHLRGHLAAEMADTSTGAIIGSQQPAHEIPRPLSPGRPRPAQRPQEGRQGKGLRLHAARAAARRPGDAAAMARARPARRRHGLAFAALTTRQTFQFHGVLKGNVKAAHPGHAPGAARFHRGLRRREPQRHGPAQSRAQCRCSQQVYEHARAWSEYALPKTRAYHEIWLDEEMVAGGEETGADVRRHLPAAQVQDRLRAAAVERRGHLLAGPRLHRHRGERPARRLQRHRRRRPGHEPRQRARRSRAWRTCSASSRRIKVNAIGEAVLTTQRDYGDRTNRRHARLKYTIEDRGIEWFRGEVERRSGITFAPGAAVSFHDHRGPARLARVRRRHLVLRPAHPQRAHQGPRRAGR